jgi:hypothetical protein
VQGTGAPQLIFTNGEEERLGGGKAVYLLRVAEGALDADKVRLARAGGSAPWLLAGGNWSLTHHPHSASLRAAGQRRRPAHRRAVRRPAGRARRVSGRAVRAARLGAHGVGQGGGHRDARGAEPRARAGGRDAGRRHPRARGRADARRAAAGGGPGGDAALHRAARQEQEGDDRRRRRRPAAGCVRGGGGGGTYDVRPQWPRLQANW